MKGKIINEVRFIKTWLAKRREGVG